MALLTYMVCTTFQSPFGGPAHVAKPSTRRTLRTAQQQQQQEQQLSLGPAEETFVVGDAKAKSYFQPWIQQDFALWEQGGIKMVRTSLLSDLRSQPWQVWVQTMAKRLLCALVSAERGDRDGLAVSGVLWRGLQVSGDQRYLVGGPHLREARRLVPVENGRR